MKFHVLSLILIVLMSSSLVAQNSEVKENVKLYKPDVSAEMQLHDALKIAQEQNKHILIQIGGNWCPWCIKFHKFINTEPQIDSIVKADYVFLLINFSKENKNLDILKKLEYPQRFGFPVLVVLDADGKRLHTQDSGLLEKDDNYDIKKVKTFFLTWNKEALKPEKYEENGK